MTEKFKRNVSDVFARAGQVAGKAVAAVAEAVKIGEAALAEQARQEDAVKMAVEAEIEELQRFKEEVGERHNIYIGKLYQEGQDTLKIGDLVFSQARTLPPPIAIRIDKQFINHKFQTLRTEQADKAASGHANARVHLSLLFVGQDDINDGLARLIATFKAIPFVPIENSFLRSNLVPNNDTDVMAFSLVSLSVRTVSQMPTTLAADLDLLFFNYKPYAPNFWLRETWDSILSDRAQYLAQNLARATTGQPIIQQAEQTKLPSQIDTKTIQPPTKQDPSLAYSPPTTDPAMSRPYQLLVNSRMGATIGTLSNEITFWYREYKGITLALPNAGKIPVTSGRLRSIDAIHMQPYADVVMKLAPEAALALEALAADFETRWRQRMPITDCFRDRMTQVELAKKDRARIDKVQLQINKIKTSGEVPPNDLIEKLKPIAAQNSWHEVGLAVDIPTNMLTEPQWNWLVVQARSHGFYVLGRHFRKWESWHFDYKPGQDKARKEYGGTSAQAIRALRSKLYYADEVTDFGGALQIEEMAQLDDKYRKSLHEQLDKAIGEGWEIDSNATMGPKLVLYKNMIFSIKNDDRELVPQGIAIAKHNIIAEIPILGHQYATHQYLGSTDMEANIVMLAVNERKLRELQGIIELTQRNARKFRTARHASSVAIRNSVFDLMGFRYGLFEGITAENVDGSPGLYNVSLQLTQYNTTQPKLSQDRFIPDYLWRQIARHIFKNHMRIGTQQIINYMTARFPPEDEKLRSTARMAASATEEKLGRKIGGSVGTRATNSPEVQKAMLDFYTDGTKWKAGNKSTGLFTDDPRGRMFRLYAAGVGLVIENRLHPDYIRQLGFDELVQVVDTINKQAAIFPMIARFIAQEVDSEPGKRDSTVFKNIEAYFKAQANFIFGSGLIFDDIFTDLRSRYSKDIDRFSRGNECLPDLHLPPHPMTGSALDTESDFWFYNDSVDGALLTPSMRLDALKALFSYMGETYKSMEEITDPEYWSKTYLSYNRPEIEAAGPIVGGIIRRRMADEQKRMAEQNLSVTDKKNLLGSFFPGEDDLGLQTSFEVQLNTIQKSAEDRLAGKDNRGLMKLDKNKIKLLNGETTVKFGPQASAGFGTLPEDDAVAQDNKGIQSHEDVRLQKMLESSFFNMDQEVFRLARAYPAFRVAFIEDDTRDNYDKKNFDDFYSYSSIKDLRIVQSRKIPADLCVISIVNVTGELDNLVYGRGEDPDSSMHIVEKYNPLTVDTRQENPFSKLVLMEGSKIQVALGYSNDPSKLETLFNGQVVSVGVSEISPSIIQIVAQSYAVELVAELKNGGEFEHTQELLSAMICQPEITHFGRWSRSENYDPSEVRLKHAGDNRPGFAGLSEKIRDIRDKALRSFTFLNDPQDDNIFAPNTDSYASWGQRKLDWMNYILGAGTLIQKMGIVDDDRIYHPRAVTVWDIFKEMELRHPGYIAAPVPYGNRMTMFFGPPNHRYWARPMTREEILNRNFTAEIEHKVTIDAFRSNPSDINPFKRVSIEDLKRYKESLEWMLKERHKRYRPFRSYHYLSTQHNIVANNLTASSHNTFNAVRLGYMDDVIGEDAGMYQGIPHPGLLKKALADNLTYLEMKADDNIEDKDTRVMDVLYSSCYGSFYARRYAAALLARSLRDVYKGTIYVTGNPAIKPYDQCFIYDDFRDMYGPVEVEQVTHIFSHDTGFITEIRPDLIVATNDLITQCTLDAMWQAANQIYETTVSRSSTLGERIPGIATAAATISLAHNFGGVGLGIALMGGYKIMQWTQLRQPLVITPVTLGFKPLIAGINGYATDNFFVSVRGKLKKWWHNVEDGWEVFWKSSLPDWAVGKVKKHVTG